MKRDNARFLLLALAAGVAGGVAAASVSRRRQRWSARAHEDRSQTGSWENEGGNVMPGSASLGGGAASDPGATPPRSHVYSHLARPVDQPRFSNPSLHEKATPCDMT